MSSSVCQGLESCLELRHIESRLLMLKLAPPVTNFLPSSVAPHTKPKPMPFTEVKDAITVDDCKSIGNRNVDTVGRSFLQSLANANGSNSTRNDKVYMHPLVKRSASMLSERSLEMCTENLGSETGSEVSESIDNVLLSKPRESSARKKTSRVNCFPPPLTSISGSNCVELKSLREGGRLVLQAVITPPCNSYFHTERSEGRLRFSLFKDADASKVDDDKEEDREEVVQKHDEDGENNIVVKGKVKDIWKEIVGVLGSKSETEEIWPSTFFTVENLQHQAGASFPTDYPATSMLKP
ncbi:mitochondrial Rho GTPase 1-like [Hibiscus syriacus]|uniref:Mitochondrial Rho GTPase 1-like n=1 Tax=Hibiscus syriacus TaxID=106335 RepID=A0A6A2YJR4_HIBSY|nr:protein FANTASTIC FOUR 2-like [Hibiscus syriacus]KAE8676774.1 mitochondrial Rho GTPase 1-like [Hibiscus syriacus]